MKDAQPDDAQDFTFDSEREPAGQATRAGLRRGRDELNVRRSSLALGTYDVAEISIPAGWTLGNISRPSVTVTIGADSDHAGDTGVSVTLAVGQNVTRTFTNTKQGSLTIVKDAQPNDAQDFNIASSVEPAGQQLLGAG